MLLKCFKDKSAWYGIESPIKQTKYLRNELHRRFPDEIDLAPVGKYIIVYISLHSTIDNNDGCQETMTDSGTTHHTNSTFFQ